MTNIMGLLVGGVETTLQAIVQILVQLLLPNVRQVAAADFEGGPFPEKYEIAFD